MMTLDDLKKAVLISNLLTNGRKPTEIYDEEFAYHAKVEIAAKYYLGNDALRYSNEMGKWMMFFKKTELDRKWQEICDLYDQGVLDGIDSLKCSTNFKSPRVSDSDYLSSGVVILYCGPASDEKRVMEYGENILKYVEYEGHDFMYYKTDEQTRAGTRAMGQKKNHLYRIAVPKPLPRDFYKKMKNLSIHSEQNLFDSKSDQKNVESTHNSSDSNRNTVPSSSNVDDSGPVIAPVSLRPSWLKRVP